MTDLLHDHSKTIKAVVVALYGSFYLIMAIWLIYRGAHETWVRRVPGRIVLGIFLLASCYREWDTTYSLLRYGRTTAATVANTDLWSTLPLVVGAFFGLWATWRFIRNTVGAYPAEDHDRIAEATERLAAATEVIADHTAGKGDTE